MSDRLKEEKMKLENEFLNTTWQAKGIIFEVKKVYLDKWRGQWCIEFKDNSWAPVENLRKLASKVEA